MLNNNLYNLMAQMVEESQSLWRIKNTYTQAARNCGECVTFWNELAKDKEEHIKQLKELIKSHFD